MKELLNKMCSKLLFSIIGLIIISISFNSVYAMTIDQLMQSNPSAADIQRAVDNGDIKYSDLPGIFQVNIHDKGSDISTPTKSNTDTYYPKDNPNKKIDNHPDFLGIVIMVGSIGIGIGLPIIIKLYSKKKYVKSLKITRYTKDDNANFETKDYDLSTLDNHIDLDKVQHITNEEYFRNKESLKKVTHKPVKQIHLGHLILIALGLAKVKHNG